MFCVKYSCVYLSHRVFCSSDCTFSFRPKFALGASYRVFFVEPPPSEGKKKSQCTFAPQHVPLPISYWPGFLNTFRRCPAPHTWVPNKTGLTPLQSHPRRCRKRATWDWELEVLCTSSRFNKLENHHIVGIDECWLYSTTHRAAESCYSVAQRVVLYNQQ